MKISSNVENDNFNYLVIDKKLNMKFTLNKYKTDKKYHSINIDIPDPLKEVISPTHKRTEGRAPCGALSLLQKDAALQGESSRNRC